MRWRNLTALLLGLSVLWSSAVQAQPPLGAFGLAGILDPGAAGYVVPRHAGKPDPRWKAFDWRFVDVPLQNSRMRLFFYSGEEWTARLALPEVRRQIDELSKVFNYQLKKNFSYLLFSSHRNFQQTNVFNITEGVQGVTSTMEPIMAIPYWGQRETFRHISTHEMVHQFEIQKIPQESLQLFPLWFIEGMAEYYSLRGMDRESEYYLRDLAVFPDKSRGHEMPKLLDEGPLNFIGIYKAGQAKLDFFDSEFGAGTSQRILDAVSGTKSGNQSNFPGLLASVLETNVPDLEKRWISYLDRRYKNPAAQLRQDFTSFEEVEMIGEAVDHYEISPDGRILVTRELDILTGASTLQMIDLEHGNRRTKIDEDRKPGSLSFHFMQVPVLAVGNETIAYVAETISGPEIEVRRYARSGDRIKFLDEHRIKLHEHGIQEASSLAINPDEGKLAFVGLDTEGRENAFWIDISKKKVPVPHPLGKVHYSVRELRWTSEGILMASDETDDGRYGIFLLNPETGERQRLRVSETKGTDLVAPDGKTSDLYFQSWSSGSSQIHRITPEGETRLTEVKTALFYPRFRGDKLYFLGFKTGRYHLYRISPDKFLNIKVGAAAEEAASKAAPEVPWTPQLADMPSNEVQRYSSFKWSNLRLDQLGGFLTSGGFGLSVGASDMMRDYSLSTQVFSFGSADQSSASIFLSSQRGRTDWTMGLYYFSLPRVDFSDDGIIRNDYYLHKEGGVSIGARYPFGAFYYGEAILGFARVSRSNYVVPDTTINFQARFPGDDWTLSPTFRLGRDRILYETFTGPISGYGVMLESVFNIYTGGGSLARRYRLDGSYYLRILGPTVLALEGILGIAEGDLVNPFYVSSDDILRAYRFGDVRLIGKYLAATRTELRFPIGLLFKAPVIRGMVGLDYGSVFNATRQAGTNVTSAFSTGFLFNLPPLSIGFVWTKPLRAAPGPIDNSLFHFTLRYLYF